eukprot:7948320-Ditylum_brightwellii.AAC.1
MGLSCSSTALLLLCGGRCGGGINAFDITVVLVSEKKKEEDARRAHSHFKKLFHEQLVWEEKAKWMR